VSVLLFENNRKRVLSIFRVHTGVVLLKYKLQQKF